MILEVRHLRILVAIADHGTVSAATRHVYLTQSAISHQLIELEQRVGTTFFHRTPKGMIPTDAGRAIIGVARDVLARLAAAEADILRASPRAATRLRVGTDSPAALAWLPAAVADVRQRLPHVRAELVPETSTHAVDALYDGRYEVAVTTEAADDPRLVLQPLFEEELIAVVARSHRFGSRSALAPRDLRVEHVAIHATRPSDQRWLTDQLTAADLEPRRLTPLALTEALLGLAEAGEAVAIVSRGAASAALRAGILTGLRIGPRGLRRQWQMVTLATGVSALHVQCMASAIQQVAARAAVAGDAAPAPVPASEPARGHHPPRVPRSA